MTLQILQRTFQFQVFKPCDVIEAARVTFSKYRCTHVLQIVKHNRRTKFLMIQNISRSMSGHMFQVDSLVVNVDRELVWIRLDG